MHILCVYKENIWSNDAYDVTCKCKLDNFIDWFTKKESNKVPEPSRYMISTSVAPSTVTPALRMNMSGHSGLTMILSLFVMLIDCPDPLRASFTSTVDPGSSNVGPSAVTVKSVEPAMSTTSSEPVGQTGTMLEKQITSMLLNSEQGFIF